MLRSQNTNASPMQLLETMFDAEMSFMRSEPKDVRLLVRAFHPDVVVHEPVSRPYAGDWRGLNGVADLIRKMNETFSEMRVEGLQCSAKQEAIFVSCTLHLTSRATDIVLQQPFVEILRFEDGLLIEGTPFYYDTAQILATVDTSSDRKGPTSALVTSPVHLVGGVRL